MSTATIRAKPRAKPRDGEPAWDIAYLFPAQGEWSEEGYFALPGNRLIEYADGTIEVLPMPTIPHQRISRALFLALLAFVGLRKLGEVLYAPARVRLWTRKFREPDVLFMLAEHSDRIKTEYFEGADLVMEVVSADKESRKRDLEEKPLDYARARIPEYWIVDPKEETITVLRLKARKYVVHGKFSRGGRATSALLEGFDVSVDEMLSAE